MKIHRLSIHATVKHHSGDTANRDFVIETSISIHSGATTRISCGYKIVDAAIDTQWSVPDFVYEILEQI